MTGECSKMSVPPNLTRTFKIIPINLKHNFRDSSTNQFKINLYEEIDVNK